MSILRLASLPGNTFFRLGAPPYLAANVAVPVTIQYPFWPKIIDQPVIAIGDVGDAKYLWYRSDVDPALVATGQTVFFGREVNVASFTSAPFNTIIVKIATDNAFQARLRIFSDVLDLAVYDFFDGSTSQNTNEPAPPFNWQKVYTFTRQMIIGADTNVLNIEFEVKTVNYAQSGGSQLTNPAGLMYSIEISNLQANINSIVEVVPPTITNPLA